MFAFLFGPPRFVERSEAARLYDAVCRSLALDDFNLQYNSTGPDASAVVPCSRGFSIQLLRREGRGGFTLQLSNQLVKPEALHLMLNYDWPPSPEIADRYFDAASRAVFETLEGEWQRVLAEVRLRGQCAAVGGEGLRYIQNELLRLPQEWLLSLGEPATMASLRLEVAATEPGDSPLDNPARSLTLEVLREDRRSLYVELVSTWPQLADPRPTTVRQIEEQPSTHVQAAREFLIERLRSLARR
ncbi:MAG: hypothetical protein AB1486_02055 [Planctomycetota bacterium]